MKLSRDQALLKARTLAARGQHNEADSLFRAILAHYPNDAGALRGLGLPERSTPFPEQARLFDHYNRGQLNEALTLASALTAATPMDAGLHNVSGAIYAGLNQWDEAVASYRRAIAIAPRFAEAHNNLGAALRDTGRFDEAVDAYRAAITLTPRFAQAHNNLGNALRERGRLDEAADCYRRALAAQPDYAEASNNLGVTLGALGLLEAAATAYRRAAEINPRYAEAHNNLGAALKGLGQLEEAVACFEQALELRPNFAEAHNNLGNAMKDMGRPDLAVEHYRRALDVRPGYDGALAQMLNQLAHMCDFDAIDAAARDIANLGLQKGNVPPFAMLTLEDVPERHLLRSITHAGKYVRAATPPPRPSYRPQRLRIGYFSADFHNHATMYLMAQLFDRHDQKRFSIHAYSFGPDRDDAMRRRLVMAVDQFKDVRDLSDDAIAALARDDGIDIAIDLKGYTVLSRPGIFAYRPAALSMSYLGYPGSMGADFIDYILADAVVLPPGDHAFYTEKPAYLKHSYQVNDRGRMISDRVFTRAEQGLPETGVVFCCFNNSYKIGRPAFEIWMRLLTQTQGSVLWLLASNAWAQANLQAQAAALGVDPTRLAFADKLPHSEHLARHRCADLFLDTFNYNAHTTASDALWAGLPVLTRAGRGFPARVAASLLTAVGLPEMIAETEEAYERLALELAHDPARLAAITAKLAANRLTTPLFDSAAFVEELETLYDRAYERLLTGQAPDVLNAR